MTRPWPWRRRSRSREGLALLHHVLIIALRHGDEVEAVFEETEDVREEGAQVGDVFVHEGVVISRDLTLKVEVPLTNALFGELEEKGGHGQNVGVDT